MKLFTLMACIMACLLIVLNACKPQLPVQESLPCSLLNFRAINKTTDPVLAKVREETILIDGQSLKMGASTRIEYTFDQQNRPVASIYDAYGFSNYHGSETFEYSPNKLTVKTTNPSGGISEVTFPLTDEGLVAGAKYNADGFCTEERSGSHQTTHTIENGNIVRKEVRDRSNDSLFSVVLYEYDLTRPNLPNVTPYKGKISRNLPIKETHRVYSGASGPTTRVYEYVYTFDSAGRPDRRYNKSGDGVGNYEVMDFDYTCRP